jgi:tRNA-Thr(GGU) m(6)t(6)A37 methyltransferase TsaA
MMEDMMNRQRGSEKFEVFPVGYVKRDGEKTVLEILVPYIPALKELDKFSHVQVFWWFGEFDGDEYREIMQSEHAPYDAPVLGMFACRSPVRPNPIALTTAEILDVDLEKGRIEIVNIDAFDGTPVIDLKPYIPVTDRVKDVRVPEWAADWPQWLPEDGQGLEEGEE